MAGLQTVQTDFSFNPQVGKPGLPYAANGAQNEFVSYPASAAISPGQLLEVVNGAVRPAQSVNGTLKPLAGVAVLNPAKAPAPSTWGSPAPAVYAVGEMVQVLRKGRIYALWSAAGVTQGELVTASYKHSSDGSSEQGYFTDHAQVTTAGVEVDPCPNGVLFVAPTGSTTMCLVELNLPA